MGQLNIHLNPAFEKALREFMRARKIQTKSEAVRVAVQEGLERATRGAEGTDFKAWLGLGLKGGPVNPNPRFRSDDDLWR